MGLWIGFGSHLQAQPVCVVAWCFNTAIVDGKFAHAAGGSDGSFVPAPPMSQQTACAGLVAKTTQFFTYMCTCQHGPQI